MIKCGMCGKQDWSMDGLRDIYQVHGITNICDTCGDTLDSFVNYWGKKREEDLRALRDCINTGVLVQNKYQAMMNGGYYTQKKALQGTGHNEHSTTVKCNVTP